MDEGNEDEKLTSGNSTKIKTNSVTVQQKPGNVRRGKKGKKIKYIPLDLSGVPDTKPTYHTAVSSSQQQYQNPLSQEPKLPYASQQLGVYRNPQQSHAMKQDANQLSQRQRDNLYIKTDLVALSRALVKLLRHGKPSGIRIDSAGYAKIEDILSHSHFKTFDSSLKQIQDIVSGNDKKRFEIDQDSEGCYKIRAVQGHSIKLDPMTSGLRPLTDPNQFQTILHGTYETNWRKIKKEGLNRMSRSHVHFTIGHIGETHVTSGMRSDCEIIVELDLKKALEGGLKFYYSTNNVVLTEGDDTGIVPPKYFKSTIKKWNYKTKTFEELAYK